MFRKTNHSFDAAGRMGVLWCGLAHGSATWPIHGHYSCRTCGRHYPVPWAGPVAAPARRRQAPLPTLRSALLPLLILGVTVLLSPLRAADALIVSPSAGAAAAFARYTAGQEQVNPWRVETIEVDASLPKLAKTGRLRAVRRLVPFGRPQYQVLEIAGDQTVKQQVIVRYLSAEERAAEMPPPSVAITPANYKFRYKGLVKTGNGIVYAFQITPRKKREGLIRGEVWLDSETGAAVRQAGHMVKSPSIFVKRIDVTRETSFCDGVAEARITHLSVALRLVGRAELVIEEHPFTAADDLSSPGSGDR